MFDEVEEVLIKPAAVGVIPTDTVYGLVARAEDRAAVKRLYSLKSREHKPGTIIAADINQLVELGIKYRYIKAVEQFWPGPVSIVIPTGQSLNYLHLSQSGLAVRLPENEELKKLLQKTGPLLTTSANLPGEPVVTTIKAAKETFGNKVDIYVDGGDLSNRQPSTIIRIIDDAIEVIRQGSVII
jgi:L-threonylcarbamoyladenylate synthase